jgi:hypothetical protein
MQRLHEDDLVGHVLGQEQWEILSFPAIAEKDEEHRIENAHPRQDGADDERPDRAGSRLH